MFMERKRITKILSLLLVMFTAVSMSTFASSSTTKYAKAIATAVGEGKVYIGTVSNDPTADKYKETTEVTHSVSNTSSSTQVNFYLFAQPDNATTKFDGWYENEDCTGDAVSTANPYNASITSSATSEAAAVTKSYYAKFIEASDFYSSTLTAYVTGEGGQISVATDAETENYNDEKSSASNLNNADAKCNYYLKAQVEDEETYRFVGWYSDAACETQLSKNATYTYSVTAESQDEANPTEFSVYAKFEAIPYYYSSVHATALGAGEVYVNTKNTTTEDEWAEEADADQKIADKAEHTYYLFAQAEDATSIEFEGWYADEECTEILSKALNYTYKVTSESQDPNEVSEFNVYAKFTERNMYQVRNGGFEKWAKATEPGFGWNSFPSAVGSMASLGKGSSPNPAQVEGRTGSAVQLTSKSIFGQKANGNLTTGIVNMGSMTPADAANHNYSDVKDVEHSLLIIGQPDGFEFYTKYKKGEEGEYQGHASFLIHDQFNYRDPETADSVEHRIAKGGAFIDESEEWVRNYAEFTYDWSVDEAEATDKYLLINFTTNMTPGGSQKDTLIIDDVRLIYNSELAAAIYDEDSIEFVDGAASIDAIFDVEKLAITTNGRAASYEAAYDKKTALLTITVMGQDFEADTTNYHTYTVQYAIPKYDLTFIVENDTVKSEQLTKGAAINYPEVDPREGYTFAWDSEATEMPASALTITGAYTVNQYNVTFVVEGDTTSTKQDFGTQIEAPTDPEKVGYTFAGWNPAVDATVPANDVTYEALFTVNTYKVSYYVGENLVHEDSIQYGDSITLYEYIPEEGDRFTFNGWNGETYETMPAKDIEYVADIVDDIKIVATDDEKEEIYDITGRRHSKAVRGINIINGKKVLKK